MEAVKAVSKSLIRSWYAEEITVSEFRALNGRLCDRIVDIRANLSI